MADNFVAACEHAAEALLSFQNITRDDVQRLAVTSTSTTVNNNQPENQTTTIRSELSRRFSSYRPGRLLQSNSSTSASSSSNAASSSSNQGRRPFSNKKRGPPAKTTSKASKRGRPATSNIVYRDLVIIPDPGTKKVPTHNARMALEKNKLIVSGFPFDRSWDAVTLKSNIRQQLPNQDMLFQYVKVSCTELFSLNHLNSANN